MKTRLVIATFLALAPLHSNGFEQNVVELPENEPEVVTNDPPPDSVEFRQNLLKKRMKQRELERNQLYLDTDLSTKIKR